jgi:hypothetical protein
MSGIHLALFAGLAVVPVPDLVIAGLHLRQNAIFSIFPLVFSALCVLVAGVGAWFLRTWWALRWVPVSFFVGYTVGGVIDGFLPGFALDIAYVGLGVAIFLLFYLLPLLLVSLIATLISKRMAKRES